MRLQDKDGNALAVTAFPKHSLDTYLPKLIRAGERVAICDTVEPPKQQQKDEQKVVEKVEPKQEETRQQEQHRGMHR
jgi:DNA mismatch repair ATPase MutS